MMIRDADMELASHALGEKQRSSVQLEIPSRDQWAWDREAKKYEELGLGRGVNVTDPHMWRNKTAFLVRDIHPKLSNIVKTEEGGIVEKYEKEVSTVSIEKRKIRLSLDDPGTQVSIGMDAQQMQSSSSSVKIAGTKIKTRTISFRVEFVDIPHYTSLLKAIQAKEKQNQGKDGKATEEYFEHHFCGWILERILDRPTTTIIDLIFEKEKSTDPSIRIMRFILNLQKILMAKNEEKPQVTTRLRAKIEEVEEDYKLKDLEARVQKELDAIAADCRGFVENLGITHYVSAIELGAMKYYASMVESKHTSIGGGATIGAGSETEGGLSALTEKLLFRSTKEEHLIGRIGKDHTVERGGLDEAVIGFQIQPIYNLVRVPGLQAALQQAVKEYILKKEDPSEGPFLVSCVVDKIEVFWIVEDNCVLGTTSRKDASLFYVIPTNDPKHPSEFFITYWGKNKADRKRVMNRYDPLVKSRMDNSNLPLFLSTDGNIFGMSEGPLKLKNVVVIQQARFCLHNRVQSTFACMLCLTTPVDLSGWIDLGEQFYIKCNRRPFKIDGYIAMKCKSDPTSKASQARSSSEPNAPNSQSSSARHPTASSSIPSDVLEAASPPSKGTHEMPKQQDPPLISQSKSQEGTSEADSKKQKKADPAVKEIDRSAIKYKTVTVSSPGETEDEGMLFRLYPPEARTQQRSKKKHNFPMIFSQAFEEPTARKPAHADDVMVPEVKTGEEPEEKKSLIRADTEDNKLSMRVHLSSQPIAFNPMSQARQFQLFFGTHAEEEEEEEVIFM